MQLITIIAVVAFNRFQFTDCQFTEEAVSEFECYHCTTLVANSNCSKLPSGSDVGRCSTTGSCTKLSEGLVDGVFSSVTRGCSFESRDTCDSVAIPLGIATSSSCYCIGNLCNNSDALTAGQLSMFIISAVAAVLVLIGGKFAC